MAQSQPLEAIKNKIGCLDKHKSLRGRTKAGLNNKVHLPTSTLLKDWERWIFYLMHKNQHRVKEKEATEKYGTREQKKIKTSEKST